MAGPSNSGGGSPSTLAFALASDKRTISGLAPPNSSVQISTDGFDTVVATVTADGNGAWSYQFASTQSGVTISARSFPEASIFVPIGKLLAGVNLSGAEFGSTVPGTFGTDYFYLDNGLIDYFVNKGATCLRIPFYWERVQNGLSGPLRTQDINEIDRMVTRATSQGVYVLLDPHNYFRYAYGTLSTKKYINESGGPTTADFADLWSKLAGHFKNNPRVIFGLMNEPFNTEASGTPANTYPNMIAVWNAAVAAIRNAGATQLILVPGSEFTGAHSLVGGGSAAALLNVVDPGNNMAIEVHQYLDSDDSGTYPPDSFGTSVIGKGATVLQQVTDWARSNGKTLFLGEFNAPPNASGITEMRAMMDYVSANADVWVGWTGWAAGGYDKFYGLKLDPWSDVPSVDRPLWSLLRNYIPGVATPLTLASDSVQQGQVGKSYSLNLYGNGGMPPYSFAIQSGSLPAGLALSVNSQFIGSISGSPSTAAAGNPFTIRVTDAKGATADKTITIPVVVPGNPNLLSFAEDFDNAYWTKNPNVTVIPNTDVAPNGTQTMDRLQSTSTDTPQIYRGFPTDTLVVGQSYVLSIFAKADQYRAIASNIYDNVNDKGVVFNLDTGATTNRSGGGTEGASGVIDIGGGIKRCWFSFVASGANGGTVAFYPCQPGGFVTGPWVVGSGLAAWGAKLEQGSSLSSYPP